MASPATDSGALRRWAPTVVAAVLLAQFALAMLSARHKSPVYDEMAFMTAGYTYWRFDDYRLHPENGNLAQRLVALPLLLGDAVFPDRDQPAWNRSDVWALGEQFFYGLGNDFDTMLMRSRAMTALLGAALGLTVFFWARALHGTRGGLIALVLSAFSPLIIAHGRLATSDVGTALFFTLAAWSFWECLHRPSFLRLAGGAASLAALILSKTSAVLFAPMAAAMMLIALCRKGELRLSLPGLTATLRARSGRLAAMLGVLALFAAASWAAVWLAYGNRFEPFPPADRPGFQSYMSPGGPQDPHRTLEQVGGLIGPTGKALTFLGEARLLPEALLYGSAYVVASLKRYAFLNGDYSATGWWYFFPYAFLVKTTLPMLLLLALFAAAALARSIAVRSGAPPASLARRIYPAAPLLVLLGVYWASLLTSTINIGARHMLPVYPATCILIGFLGAAEGRALLRWCVAILLVWHIVEGVRAYPHYLAYFNQIVGRSNAYRHLVDSNLDWGQDLPGLKAWLDRRLGSGPPSPVYLSYFGTGNPGYYGIRAEPLSLQARAEQGLPAVGGAGIYCVSATELQAVYPPVRGRWNQDREEEYQQLIRQIGAVRALDGPQREDWIAKREAEYARLEKRFHDLGTARLMAFLRQRAPDDHVGYSILIYELSTSDLRRAFDGPPPETSRAAAGRDNSRSGTRERS